MPLPLGTPSFDNYPSYIYPLESFILLNKLYVLSFLIALYYGEFFLLLY